MFLLGITLNSIVDFNEVKQPRQFETEKPCVWSWIFDEDVRIYRTHSGLIEHGLSTFALF